MIKISVIVPVYNSELYLSKCIKSIMEQTFKEEYELILINDGSTDHSENIIDKMIEKYGADKIIKINQKNSGQGKARNEGIKKARGKYITFVDSDDYIESNMLEDLYQKAESENAQIVICDFVEEIGKETVYKKSINKNIEDLKNDFIVCVAGPCSKLIKASIFKENDLYFPENIIYEDISIIPAIAIFADNIQYIQKQYYHYLIRENSTMRQANYSDKLESIFVAMENLENIFRKNDCFDQYYEQIEYLYIEHLLYASVGRFVEYKEGSKNIQKIINIMKTKFPNWKKNKYYKQKTLKFRCTCSLFFSNNKLLLNIYKKIRKL